MSIQDNLNHAINQGLWAYTRGAKFRQQQYNEQQEFAGKTYMNRAANFQALAAKKPSMADEYDTQAELAYNNASDVYMNLPSNYKRLDPLKASADAETQRNTVKQGMQDRAEQKLKYGKMLADDDALTEAMQAEDQPGLHYMQPIKPQSGIMQEEALGRAPEAIYGRDMVKGMQQNVANGLPQIAYDPTAGLQREDLIPAHPNGQKLLDWNGVPSGKSIEEFANNGVSEPMMQAANNQAQATIEQYQTQKEAMKEHMAVLEGKMQPTYQQEFEKYRAFKEQEDNKIQYQRDAIKEFGIRLPQTTNNKTLTLEDRYNKMVEEQNAFKEKMYAGKSLEERKKLGQFFTPPELIKQMIDNYNTDDFSGKNILDPTSGSGNLLMGMLIRGADADKIYGNEIDPEMVKLSRQRIQDFLKNNPEYGNGYEFDPKQIHIGNALLASSLQNWDVADSDIDYLESVIEEANNIKKLPKSKRSKHITDEGLDQLIEAIKLDNATFDKIVSKKLKHKNRGK